LYLGLGGHPKPAIEAKFKGFSAILMMMSYGERGSAANKSVYGEIAGQGGPLLCESIFGLTNAYILATAF
jgi:hypothetical protein